MTPIADTILDIAAATLGVTAAVAFHRDRLHRGTFEYRLAIISGVLGCVGGLVWVLEKLL